MQHPHYASEPTTADEVRKGPELYGLRHSACGSLSIAEPSDNLRCAWSAINAKLADQLSSTASTARSRGTTHASVVYDKEYAQKTSAAILQVVEVGAPVSRSNSDTPRLEGASQWTKRRALCLPQMVKVVRETMQPAHLSLCLRPDTAPQRQQAD